MKLVLVPALAALAAAQTWVPQSSGTGASLRGAGVFDRLEVWASGTGGTWLHTVDGGASWTAGKVAGAEDLDFRDVHAAAPGAAYLLASGPGDKSRVYKTVDAGRQWRLQLTNPDAAGFWDALAFWNARRGLLVGDPVNGRFTIFATEDGGEHWMRLPGPAALAGEGMFAASGTCLVVRGRREAWFGTGGPGAARVFHSRDGGRTWNAAVTPIRADAPSAGVFSLAFSDARHGVAVGGDYSKPAAVEGNAAVTSDGGRTWTRPPGHPGGFRSAVAFVRRPGTSMATGTTGDVFPVPGTGMWIVTGTSGSDVSFDGGLNWRQFDTGAYNALTFSSRGAGWAVGPQGRVASFRR